MNIENSTKVQISKECLKTKSGMKWATQGFSGQTEKLKILASKKTSWEQLINNKSILEQIFAKSN